ncbi:DUF1772 domain-containing protein [Roseobacter sp. YSTF-M11]|uniref:DUF1772 domain-containing protein n=1 Tax=Roseobacter insulae TaxID=2859783 RepID=A0A9X1K0F8_9RHOB|nr:anthrone oxygenase family protein [Roseobacter insulae]MBW4710190.1 DUF1772 domain-containing protein [Roseobacter insulae]
MIVSISPLIAGLVGMSMACGLVAGVLLAFSDFVMKSLVAAHPAAGTQAMQIINRKVYRSLFMLLFVGLIPVSLGLALVGAYFLDGPAQSSLVVAASLYVLGVFGVSAVGNVPMNQKLAACADGSEDAQAYWPAYANAWVLCNHVRWIAALGATGCYMLAALHLAQTS